MWDLGLAKHIHSVWLISGRRYVSGCCLTRFWWHVQSGCSYVQLCWCSKYFGKWQWVPKYSLCRVKAVNGYTYPLLQLCLSSSGSVVQRGVGGWKFPPLSNHNSPPPPRNLDIEYGYYCQVLTTILSQISSEAIWEDLNSKFSWGEGGACPQAPK